MAWGGQRGRAKLSLKTWRGTRERKGAHNKREAQSGSPRGELSRWAILRPIQVSDSAGTVFWIMLNYASKNKINYASKLSWEVQVSQTVAKTLSENGSVYDFSVHGFSWGYLDAPSLGHWCLLEKCSQEARRDARCYIHQAFGPHLENLSFFSLKKF